jgi:ADP-heptose:LPS heptosyltransferase
MNFPGLEPAWNAFHETLFRFGKIRPWTLDTCKGRVSKDAKVLVVASTALGDSILCTPLLQSLAAGLGPERVGFLVREPFRELYEDSKWIGSLFSVRGKFRGLRELRQRLKDENFTVALIANCTEPDLVPWLWWCGIRGYLRYPTRWSRWHEWFANVDQMRRPDSPEYATGHAIENNLAMAEALGIQATTHQLRIDLASAKAEDSDRRLVVIHPGASRSGKCWPLDNWGIVAEELKKQFNCKFAITGSGTEEMVMAGELAQKLPQPVENLAGKLTLKGVAQLQKSTALFVSGDTGPYHLAVAVGCPTVTLFAPRDRGSSIEACGPHLAPVEKHIAIQTSGFSRPISEIPTEPVLAAAREILSITRKQ